jgi:hypothetical protein
MTTANNEATSEVKMSEQLKQLLAANKCSLSSNGVKKILGELYYTGGGGDITAPISQLGALQEVLDAIHRKITHNIYNAIDTHGAMTGTEVDPKDVDAGGCQLHRTPREIAGDAVPSLSQYGDKALLKLQEIDEASREILDVAREHGAQDTQGRMAARTLETALAPLFSGPIQDSYEAVADSFRLLNASYKNYLIRYGNEISGETLNLIADAANIANVALAHAEQARAAEMQKRVRGT